MERPEGSDWLVGDKRLSEKVVGRLEQSHLVEESFVRGEPLLTIVGQAIKVRLQKCSRVRLLPAE